MTINEWIAQAKFIKEEDNLFRIETYLQYGCAESTNIIASIIMFNPGSCLPRNNIYGRFDKASLDSTMRCLISIIKEAYLEANKAIEVGSIIIIKNLFNLCEPNQDNAIQKFQSLSGENVYPDFQIDKNSLFVWKAWGKTPNCFNTLIDKWNSNLKGIQIVGDEPQKGLNCYHPLYLNRDRKRRALLIKQIVSIIQ